MTGYFFFGSKSNGFHMFPYRSVTPSAAFTTNVSGIFHPAAFSRDRSVSSSTISTLPVSSRSVANGAWSTRVLLVTTNFFDGESDDDWLNPPAFFPPPGSVLGSRQV